MQLSIIIVSYNVRHFLEMCLSSVLFATKNLEAEVIVVDNLSTDGTVDCVSKNFPLVCLIANSVNVGFAKACNQGFSVAKGEFILFLNPDTIVAEDSFEKCIDVFRRNNQIGAVGVKMVDGSGNFLRESKRSFPSPIVSLYKLLGLSSIFPSSPIFSKYHLGNLNKNEDHEVDVLSGAFMMVRADILKTLRGFDEDYFMYGEDIDLSYRIRQLGFKNYYLSQSTIIHFKGESTSKGSLNYIRLFYKAMSIFVNKHYGGTKGSIFNLSINIAIWLRASITFIGGLIKKLSLPVVDFILFLSSFWIIKLMWNAYVKETIQYSPPLLWSFFITSSLFYVLMLWFWGAYDTKAHSSKKFPIAFIISLALVLIVYALLPERLRFSRAIIVLGSALGFAVSILIRFFLNKVGLISTNSPAHKHYPTVVLGNKKAYEQVLSLLKNDKERSTIIGRVAVEKEEDAIGTVEALFNIQKAIGFESIIFSNVWGYKLVIEILKKMPKNVYAKFFDTGGAVIIESHSKNEAGTIYSQQEYRLNNPFYKRSKRILDIVASIVLLAMLPINIFYFKNFKILFSRIFQVLIGKKTWVGYTANEVALPELKPCVITVGGNITHDLRHSNTAPLDKWYATYYSTWIDIKILFRNYNKLDNIL